MSNPADVPRETALHVRDQCLCLHAQRAARTLARRFDEAFRPLGLTNGQFSLMMALSGPEPPPMGRIARFLAMDRTTLTAALKPLERRGLVEVRPHPTDRRSRVLLLTRAGRALLARAVPIWCETHREVESVLAQGEADRLRAALQVLS
ncbi:MarR family winged helix-turn-helix transcriptional regulator [Elioraea sp.]|jgi:DNA-binding MarR family transcriptional regulator|uniref:MarR family winged helix-turn-helix transcriptional regulator n=1 Tax=Elioraea sp. TaxID=2185103 RepID=UPI0021DBF1B9|nr:MarR family transcriptional regulator [Elioraea sp.]GIX11946.1 MAG: MarR family transcriptional regulator [Elioraea sp.]